MIQVAAGVLLDAEEADYVARALESFAQVLATQRSQPTARLAAVTTRLRKAVVAANGLRTRADGSRPQPSERRDTQQDSPHDAGYATVGTGEAARILGCTPGNVRDLARRGRLTVTHTGTRWRFDVAAVIALAERRAAKRGAKG